MVKTILTNTKWSNNVNYNFVPYLKILAVFLVINSHLDMYYPNPILATGGALGNGLFFIVSGFCLSNLKHDFTKWYRYRILRIYPQTVFMAVLIFFINTPPINSFYDFFSLILWPTKYWFIGAIAIFYIPYFFIFVDKNRIKTLFLFTSCILFGVYFVCYLLLDTSSWVVENSDVTNLSSYFRFT